jgi:asparagine synthase (glutamine-hydrolysing)
MCGIAGIVRMCGHASIEPEPLMRMRAALAHRGPDDSDLKVWTSAGLAASRLAVLDVTKAGRMPMASADGRYWIVHNGEIYNHVELRDDLEKQGHHFRSGTDTEVILKLYELEGSGMLNRLNGMFAFAIWDEQKEELFAARDRMGEKPFYYSSHQGAFYFGSEQKALFAAGVPASFDCETFCELLWFRTVAGEATPFENVSRLLPGHCLMADENGFQTRRWYRPEDSQEDWTEDQFRELLEDSVRIRRRADVKVGVLLSGGLDSSSVAAVLAEQAGPGIPSFHVRFEEERFNESNFARMVAKSNGHEYHDIVVGRNELPTLLEEATWLRDEPMAYAAGGHLLAIARYAKQHVTVLLSGEGSDEIFGGYGRYKPLRFPRSLALGSYVASRLPFAAGGVRWQYLRGMGRAGRPRWVHTFNSSLGREFAESYTHWPYRETIAQRAASGRRDLVRQAMYYDQHTALQSILDQSDRYTMGAGIECRLPFMDHRICEMASGLPTKSLFRLTTGKQVLVRAMAGRIPQPVLDRKKRGFSAPWGLYMREIPSLREWVRSLPEQEAVKSWPLDPALVSSSVNGFLAGDDKPLGLVWALTRIAVWHEVCVKKRRIF